MFQLSIAQSAYDPFESASIVAALIEALVEADLIYIRKTRASLRPVPPLYGAGVRYRADLPGQDIPTMLQTREADCKSLVAWRIAEHRDAGRDARVHILFVRDGKIDRMHVQLLVDRTIEDPSVECGMPR